MTYKDKLLDPRWQKVRLEILSRDNFKCKICGDEESTLHVHHEEYNSDNPWETPIDKLTTLCKHCHSILEYNKRIGADVTIISVIKRAASKHTKLLVLYVDNEGDRCVDFFTYRPDSMFLRFTTLESSIRSLLTKNKKVNGKKR